MVRRCRVATRGPTARTEGGQVGHGAMHVCDITMLYAAQSGGVRRYLDAKRSWLRQHGWRHTLLIPTAAAAPEQAATIGLRSVPLPLSHGYRVPLSRAEAAAKLRAVRPDLIEAGDPYQLAWAALDAAAALNVPAVTFCHSDLPQMLARCIGAHGQRLARAYLRRLYSRFDLVLAPSATMAATLRELGVACVAHQRLGVDTAVFSPAHRDPSLRERLAIDPSLRLLVYCGRFAPEKNLSVLCEALRLLGARYVLLLVGAGASLPDVPANVRVLPYVGEARRLAALMAGCDAFVHAGDQETFGLAALEAMACGLPVVAARAGGLREQITGETGVLVTPRDARAMAEGISALFEQDVARMSMRARAHAQACDWSRVLPELVQRYRVLCGTHHKTVRAA